ncbi:melanoma inhibitory activity protein 2-like, partial [Mesocricetus auratus]|uniref:Melanoma inhibitory activity protein 2-like n=1 Tax=Mesocricetus auratus TaxID=10036 RepID=A0ABM2X300_MESAU
MIALATPPQWCQPATGAFRFSEPCLLSPGVLLASGPAACPLPVGSAIAEPCTSAVCVQRGSELQHGVVAAVPEDNTVSVDPSPASLELVTCLLIFGLLAVVLLVCRVYRSIQSRFYVVREQKLALELSVLLKEKCKLLEQVSLAQKEYEALESSLKEANFDKVSTDAQSLEATYKNLERDKSQSGDELLILEKKLEERTKHHEQDELLLQDAEVMKEEADQVNKLLIVTVLQNSTVPNSPPAECKTPGLGFVPPPVPQDRSPRDTPFAGDPRKTPPLPPPPPGNSYASPPDYFPPRDFIEPPFRSYPDEPELSAMPPAKNDNKSDRCNSTVPATPPAECKTYGPGFIPPPVPLDRGPRGPPFAWDPRRPPLFPPPTPGNIYGGRPDYFPPRDFARPPFPPYPDESESSAEPSTKNDNKSDCSTSTVPNTPAECKTPGPGFVPPPVFQDRGPRGPPFAGDPRRLPSMDFAGPHFPPYPAYSDAALQWQDRFYSESGRLPRPRQHGNYNMPPLLDLDEPEWSAVPSTKNDNKSNHNNNTVPNIPPAECKTPGPGFVPPPVPLDRDPRGRPFAWDPRRPPPFPLPPPGNIYGGSTDYFPPMDFAGPPFPPYP